MARIRTIKPEFFRSPDTAKVSFEGRLFYQALWCWADDFGIGETNINGLLGFAFCDDDEMSAQDVRRFCAEVARHYAVTFYTVRGRHYYAIPSWDKHQKTERRSERRKHPTPDDPESAPDLRFYSGAESAPQMQRETGAKAALEQGNRGTGEQSSSSEIADAITDADEPQREDVTQVCEHLADRIEANGVNRPAVTKRWHTSARLLIDKDGYSVEQITWLIDRATADEFWRGNILSMPKFREKADQLKLKFRPVSTAPEVPGQIDASISWMRRRPGQ